MRRSACPERSCSLVSAATMAAVCRRGSSACARRGGDVDAVSVTGADGAGQDGRQGRSRSVRRRVVRDRPVSQSLSAPVRRRRARSLFPSTRPEDRGGESMPHRRWRDRGARHGPRGRRCHVCEAQGSLRPLVADVVAAGLGRLLDRRTCDRLFVGGRRRPSARLSVDPRPHSTP